MLVDEVVKHLKADLKFKRPPLKHAFRMRYHQLALNCETQFHGIPLRSVLVPPVAGTDVELEAMFDSWMDGVKHGYDPMEALVERPGAEVLVGFMKQGKTPEEQIVRLLIALGNAEGASLSVGKDRLVVNSQFGITDGVINSRFCKNRPIAVDLLSIYSDRQLVRTFDKDFCFLYRFCYGINTPTLEALIAIKQASPRFCFRTITEDVKPPKTPPNGYIENLERLLFVDKDPFLKLYRRLVPTWMTKGEFGKHIVRVSVRAVDPNDEDRQVVLNKMLKFFHDRKQDAKAHSSTRTA